MLLRVFISVAFQPFSNRASLKIETNVSTNVPLLGGVVCYDGLNAYGVIVVETRIFKEALSV